MDEETMKMIEEKAAVLAKGKAAKIRTEQSKEYRKEKYQLVLVFDSEVKERLKALGVKPATWSKQVLLKAIEEAEKEKNNG